MSLSTGRVNIFQTAEESSIFLPISRDVVHCPWSLVVLQDKIMVLGLCLGLEGHVLSPGLGLVAQVLVNVSGT